MIRITLPRDRWRLGTLQVEDVAGHLVAGPFPCYGKADNAEALAHGNPSRAPTRPYGDHPLGIYRITEFREHYKDFGPWFILLEPTAGPALVAARNGRSGLAIHGGPLNAEGRLRPTFGCVRVHDATLLAIRSFLSVGDSVFSEEALDVPQRSDPTLPAMSTSVGQG